MVKKRHAFTAIEQAVVEARAQGIEIVRGGCLFDWSGLGEDKSLPRACCATGAVLIQMGYGKSSFTYNGKIEVYGTGKERPEGWPLLVQKHLDVGVWWLWCFWMGWDYHNQIQTPVKDKNGDTIGWKDDEVSRMAIRMSKRLCR
jgi:hypothetical protein